MSNISFGDYSFGNMFGESNGFATDGEIGVNLRSNDSFLGFDQSKISSSIFDVMSSVGSTAVAAAGQAAGKAIGDAINPSATNNQLLRNFFASFSSTPTGQQVQQQAIMGNVQSFFMSPVVWFVAAASVVVIGILAFKGK